MTSIQVLPYLGAGSSQDEGFIFVPEGMGGIINFNNGKVGQGSYYSEVYGWDEGNKRETLITENRSSMPIFGLSRNGASMLCVIEDYASVASIRADIGGKNHKFNFAYASYTTLHTVEMKLSAKTDRTVMVYESQKPEGVIRQKYMFFDTKDYSSMARNYREYLMKRHPELVKKEKESCFAWYQSNWCN
jgi:hypothetical protein